MEQQCQHSKYQISPIMHQTLLHHCAQVTNGYKVTGFCIIKRYRFTQSKLFLISKLIELKMSYEFLSERKKLRSKFKHLL